MVTGLGAETSWEVKNCRIKNIYYPKAYIHGSKGMIMSIGIPEIVIIIMM